MSDRANIGRIAVLAGGLSSERAISVKSGRAVYNALRKEGYEARWFHVGSGSAAAKTLKSAPFDAAFIALHGRFGEDGTIQKILEGMSIPYTGSGVKASRLALDKIASRRVFQRCGIPVPDYRVMDRYRAKLPPKFSFPVVVKPQMEGSSIGLSLARDKKGFDRACRKAFRYSDRIIVERYIKGREITVGVLGDKPLPVVEIIPKQVFYDFRAKYKDKNTRYEVPASLPADLYRKAQRLALAAHRALGCRDFSRVDMLLGGDGDISVLEVNSIPGLTERSLLPKAASAAGIEFGKLCVMLLELAVKNKNKKK